MMEDRDTVYVTADRAAEILGIGKDTVKEHLNRKDRPLPHLPIGNVKYIRKSILEEYFSTFEVGCVPGRRP